MKVKWLLALIFLFLAVVFLDQNNVTRACKGDLW